MYIGIDGNEANVPQRVGSNTYAYQLLRHLHRLDRQTEYRIYLKSAPLSDLPPTAALWNYRVLAPTPFWTQWRLPLDLYSHKPRPRLFFTPGHYSPRFSPVPTVISIMDLAFLYYPQTFKPLVRSQLTNWTRYSVTHARHIFTISESTKQDLVKEYHLDPDTITVTYPGPNLTPPPKWNASVRSKTLHQYHLPSKYLIYVGTKQPRKNLSNLITALDLFNQLNPHPLHLVIVGKSWHQFAPTPDQSHPCLHYTGYVPNSDLSILIKAASALVLPSLYEGFGLPVLEAMTLGTPVLASSTSSIPEITGRHAFLFDPTDPDDIARTIAKFNQTPTATRQHLSRQGKIRASQFSWRKCAQKTLEVLHELTI